MGIMKVAIFFSFITSVASFSQEASRREALSAAVGAAGAVFVPTIANAAVGESPRFSVFGLIGDGTSYSEGAAYGSDQAAKVYSPYSVYSNVGEGVYDVDGDEYKQRKIAILKETQVRLSKLDKYIEKKKWFEVKDELTRYMYETRGAVRGLAKTPAQKAIANDFFKAIEETSLSATLKKQDKCAAAAAKSVESLNQFVAAI